MNGYLIDNPTKQQLVAQAIDILGQRFSQKPQWIAAAPGRVNLIGGHVDYNDGIVLPLAINCYTVVAGADNGTRTARCHSVQMDETFEFQLDQPIHSGTNAWSNYVAGVIAGFLEKRISLPGFDIVIHSNVPVGSGLSSSAALEVAVATFLEAISGAEMPKSEKALLCQMAEHRFAGMPCGIMDQFASVFGKDQELVCLDCKTGTVELIPWNSNDVSVLIINSSAPHKLVDGEYSLRRKQSANVLRKLNSRSYRELDLDRLETNRELLTDVEFRRARHVITEIGRTKLAVSAIKAGDWHLAGQQLYSSHQSLRDDYEVSCRELDLLVNLSDEIGASGGMLGMRMTGGGFGGCTVSLADTQSLHQIVEEIGKKYLAETGITLSAFSTRPARGAHVVD